MSTKINILANYTGNAWIALMNLAFIPWYIHYLGMEAYGLIGVFATLQAWLVLLDMGISPTLNREMARYRGGTHSPQSIRELLSTLEILFAGMALLIIVGVNLLTPWLSSHWLRVKELPLSTVNSALSITGFVIAFRWVSSLYNSALTGLQELIWLNVIRSVFTTIRGLGVVSVLAWVSPTIQAFFVVQGVTSLLEVLALRVQVNRTLQPVTVSRRFSLAALRRVWRFAGGITIITLLALLLTQLDKILLSGMLPLEQFGNYALAGVVAGALSVIVRPVSSVAYPRMAELIALKDTQELVRVYHEFSQFLSVMTIPVALVVFFYSDHILLLWTRNETLTSTVAPLVSLIVIGTLLNGIMQIPALLTLAYGWTRFSIYTNCIAIVVLMPAIWFGVTYYGVMAAPVAWIVLNAGYVLIAVPFLHCYLLPEEKWPWYRQDILAPALSVVISAGLLRLMTPAPRLDSPGISMAGLAVASFVSLNLAIFFAHRVRKQLLFILKTVWIRYGKILNHG